MIYLEDKAANQLEFERLLQRTKDLLNVYLAKADVTSITPSAFEQLVYEVSTEAAKGTSFEGKLEKTTDRAFPDIVDKEYFGIEVKSSKSNYWTSVGNSVFESSRVLNIEKIYVLFGKLNTNPEVEFRNYEDCLEEISVTHSPRYQINMKLSPDQTIFSKMGVSYDQIRKDSNPIRYIRTYYETKLKPGQTLWWMSDKLEDSAVSPIVSDYSALELEVKKKIVAEVMVLFPEVFKQPRANYKNVAAHLAAQHGVVSPSLRDKFSGGGKAVIEYQAQEYKLPHVVGEMIELRTLIEAKLSRFNISKEKWLSDIDKISGSNPALTHVYREGKLLGYTKKNG